MKNRLTKKEKKIADDLAKGKYNSLPKSEIKKYSKMAQEEIKRRKAAIKGERINIRLIYEDLLSLRERAEEEGIPYQTLVASIIHKYVSGSLVDIKNISLLKKTLKDFI